MYSPSSAYQTPIRALLQVDTMNTINFIINLTNNAVTYYKDSDLNKRYNECYDIQIILNDKEIIPQICSDRLWKAYRGTGVTPHLLDSVLMALEDYVLSYVEKLTKEEATALCLYLLRKSNNVSITAVVMSAVIAFPDKLFDICCVLLKSKELFLLDRARLSKEYSVNYFRGLIPRNKMFDDERLKTNKKEFRKKPSKILFYSTKYIQVIYRKMNSNNDLTDYILLLTLHQLILKMAPNSSGVFPSD